MWQRSHGKRYLTCVYSSGMERHEGDALAQAIGAEIRVEVVRQGLTYGEVFRSVGISSSSWAHYFTACDRDVPLSVLHAICDRLGVRLSDLVAEAERRASYTDQ